MPEVIDSLPSRTYDREDKYKWGEYTDGQVYKFVKGVDYDTETSSFRQAAFQAGKKFDGLKAVTRSGKDGETEFLAVQFVKAETNGSKPAAKASDKAK